MCQVPKFRLRRLTLALGAPAWYRSACAGREVDPGERPAAASGGAAAAAEGYAGQRSGREVQIGSYPPAEVLILLSCIISM